MRPRRDPKIAEHNQRLRETLERAFAAEVAARASGGTARPSTPTAVAADSLGLMEADKEPVRVAALTITAAKVAYPHLDIQALQSGEMDFRSRAKEAVVPLLREI